MLKTYLKKITDIYKRGDAREETYYSTLEELLRNYADSTGRTKIHITNSPKKTEAGYPDFRIWDGKQHKVGHIEAKAPTVEHLDQIETTAQLKRYLSTFPNMILTNFLEFRLYRDGNLIHKTLIANPFIFKRLKTIPPVEQESEFFNLLEKFFSFSIPKIYNAKTLAIELAKRTRFLRDEVISEELKEGEESGGKGFILGFYEAFRRYLISGLSKEEFADLYSQTVSYGLFAARMRTENAFNRKLAYYLIPHSIGILREVFKFISLGDLPKQMESNVDDISEVLAVTDVKDILHKYYHDGKGEDPIVHFYETFLAEYDPQTREKRGVYYTPEAVVSYIVRSLHIILKEQFNIKDGFASDAVTVLDPAAGTLTFLAQAAKLAVEEFTSNYGEGGRENFIKEHILKNFYAFELMMAPYAIGHLKMSFLLEELGYRLQEDDRFKLFLTNTLEMEELEQSELPGMSSLSEESHLAGKVKKEQPILVIMGNPPYSGASQNKTNFIESLMKTYTNAIRKEKHGGVIHDDYVKFIRFAQWKIENEGMGIIGLITNNSYIDGLIHRGMREELLKNFDIIYILDLHGNSIKGETCPDGSKDENVFDIRVGTVISFLIKTGKTKNHDKCIYYGSLQGLRKHKYDFLNKKTITSTKWKRIKPNKPYFWFKDKDLSLQENYKKGIKLSDIFNILGSGVKTDRDKLFIDFDQGKLEERIKILLSQAYSPDFIETYNVKDSSSFPLTKRIFNKTFKSENLFDYLYRPFDIRKIYYDVGLTSRPAYNVMRNLIYGENICLIFPRICKEKNFNYGFVSNKLSDVALGGKNTGSETYVAPLYIYPFFKTPREPNFNIGFQKIINLIYTSRPSPEKIFYYIYAILYVPSYRIKYNELLKIEYPRIPFVKDYNLFHKIAEYGKRLVDLHLLKSSELDPPAAKFQGDGNNIVEGVNYCEKENRLYFNQTQYFEGITKTLWQYQIGGYQVCNNWLKNRKGRFLSLSDIRHYCKVVTALEKTIEIQKKIDELYPEIEKNVIDFKI